MINAPSLLYPSISTPAVLVDLKVLENNLMEMSKLAREAGVKLRPHIKAHGSAFIADLQIKTGAEGVDVGSIEQAEAMVAEGFSDLLVAHPFYENHKLNKLKEILKQGGCKITVVVDMIEQSETISQVGIEVGCKIPLLMKIEAGANRFGVLPGESALKFANRLSQLPGIEFIGIYSHEKAIAPTDAGVDKTAFEVLSIMEETAKMLKREGFRIEHVSVGASSTVRSVCNYLKEKKFTEITEIHPGGYAIGGMRYVRGHATTQDRCAMTVLATVVSTSQPDHAVINCGSKTLGIDSLIEYQNDPDFFWKDKLSYGVILGHPDFWLGRLSAETGCIYYKNKNKRLSLGERIQIIPNNAVVVTNLHDKLYGTRNGVIEKDIVITTRGLGT